ncbi:MAG TPA: ferritin-like domain-containing protein, partial [Acidobacteriaceae bacterium]
NLEYLEAEFYLNAATGSGLSTADALSGAGTVTGGGTAVPLAGAPAGFSDYLNEIAQDELNHVRAIQATITSLGGTPVARPAIDFGAFAALGTLAGITNPAPFNPFASYTEFLLGAFVFEDVGVTAYTGAAPAITSAAVLSAAAGIQAVEAYHAAFIRTSLFLIDAASPTPPSGTPTLVGLANKISAVRASVGGGNETPMVDAPSAAISTVVVKPPVAPSTMSTTSYVTPTEAQNVACYQPTALAFARTPQQVLNIVFATPGTGVTTGGFFPSGISGTILSS